MKVGLVTEILSHTRTGVGYFISTLIEGLLQDPKIKELVCYHSKSQKHPELLHVSHHEFKATPQIPFGTSLAALTHFRCFEGLDVLHFPVPGILFGRIPKVPYILTIHDLIPLMHPEWFPKSHVWQMKYFLPFYLKHARYIACVSEHTKRDLLLCFDLPEEKIKVVYPALLPKKRECCDTKDPYILYVGSFDPRKNIQGILEGFAYLKKRGFPHKLICVGQENPKNLSVIPREKIAQLKLEKDVKIKGYLSEEEKDALFQKASLFIWPSFYEGFGLPLLEAMHFGVPIVTARTSSIPEVVGDAALFVDPREGEEIGEKMAEILSDPTLARSLSEQGKQRAELFTLERLACGYRDLYRLSL